jgi:hypothetical protein
VRRPVLVVGAEAATPLYTLTSVTQLQHQPSNPSQARIRVLGVGDYVFDASSTRAAGPDVIVPTGLENESGRWVRAASERGRQAVVMVGDYGVTGSGSD